AFPVRLPWRKRQLNSYEARRLDETEKRERYHAPIREDGWLVSQRDESAETQHAVLRSLRSARKRMLPKAELRCRTIQVPRKGDSRYNKEIVLAFQTLYRASKPNRKLRTLVLAKANESQRDRANLWAAESCYRSLRASESLKQGFRFVDFG